MTNNNAATAGQPWPLPSPDNDALKDACLQAHSAVQWLARLANSYQVPASDASHLHMAWNAERKAITTGEIAENTVVEMQLPDLVLQFQENGVLTKHQVQLDDRSPAEIEAWTLIELLHRGFDRSKYSKMLPYDVSSLLSGDARHYQTLGSEAAFTSLADWLSVAGDVLRQAGDNAAASGLGKATDVQFSPQDLSLFVRIQLQNDRSADENYVEAGFRVGDWQSCEPYFYALSKPAVKSDDLPNPLAHGTWLKGGATAALGIAQVQESNLDVSDIETFFALADRSKRS